MKKLMAFAAVACVAASAFVSCGGSASLKTDEDSVSYAIGMDIGMQFKDHPAINLDPLLAGIKDAFAGNEQFESSEIGRIVNEYLTVKLPAKNLEASNKFLEEVQKNNPNIQKTESGLLYEILVAGDQNVKASSDEDVVKVVYHGELKDGKVFDSSKERGDTVELALNRVIAGWQEGMKLVGKGGKIKLWIPADLAYGVQGAGQIQPNEAITFEVDLVDVIPAATDDAANEEAAK